MLAAMLALTTLQVEAEVDLPERLPPDAKVDRYLEEIAGPIRSILVEMRAVSGSASRMQHVQVKGPIPVTDVIELVTFQVASAKSYWEAPGEYEVMVIGDTRFARVKADHHCPSSCSPGTNYTYSHRNGRWALHTADTWVQ